MDGEEVTATGRGNITRGPPSEPARTIDHGALIFILIIILSGGVFQL